MRADAVERWDDLLRDIPAERWDVYMSEGFHALYGDRGGAPTCFVARDAGEAYLLPGLLQRDPSGLRFVSAYGYGGPAASTDDPHFIAHASAAVHAHMTEMGVRSATLRLHPVLGNHRLLGAEWTVEGSRQTAGIDLRLSPDEILGAMHGKHRNAIARATRLGLEFVWDEGLESLDEFVRLYDATMARLQADQPYYYGAHYYDVFRHSLGDERFVGLVRDGERTVSAALFMRHGPYGHYHLSGSVEDSPPGSGQLLIHQAALQLRSRGAELLHLGGGVTVSPDDTLLRFKQRFGQLRFDYHVATWVAEPNGTRPHRSQEDR